MGKLLHKKENNKILLQIGIFDVLTRLFFSHFWKISKMYNFYKKAKIAKSGNGKNSFFEFNF